MQLRPVEHALQGMLIDLAATSNEINWAAPDEPTPNKVFGRLRTLFRTAWHSIVFAGAATDRTRAVPSVAWVALTLGAFAVAASAIAASTTVSSGLTRVLLLGAGALIAFVPLFSAHYEARCVEPASVRKIVGEVFIGAAVHGFAWMFVFMTIWLVRNAVPDLPMRLNQPAALTVVVIGFAFLCRLAVVRSSSVLAEPSAFRDHIAYALSSISFPVVIVVIYVALARLLPGVIPWLPA